MIFRGPLQSLTFCEEAKGEPQTRQHFPWTHKKPADATWRLSVCRQDSKREWKEVLPPWIPPVELPSHGAAGIQIDRAWQRLMVSSLRRWVDWARQTQHGCPFIISHPSGYVMTMLNKTSGISPLTAQTSWFSEQLQDYYSRRNITINILHSIDGKKNQSLYAPYSSKARQRTQVSL